MKLNYTLDGGIANRAGLGVIVLQADETLEPELGPLFAIDGVALYHARVPCANEITPETLRRSKQDLPVTAALLPTARPLDVVAYACTSGTTVLGMEAVAAALHSAHPDAAVTNPVLALIEACSALGLRKIGFLTPYLPVVSQAMRALLEENGLEIATFGSFEQESDRAVARISHRSVINAVAAVAGDDTVDAVFASCTNLRSFAIIDLMEAEIGKPVLTSNLVLAWHMAQLAGLSGEVRGPGRLFRT